MNINSTLVKLDDHGTPVTTSLAIADGVGNPHASVIRLIRDNQADLEEFGPLGFEIRMGKPLEQGGFARSTEYAILNEQQATLLLTYMRNNKVVKQFKKRLVRAFYELVNIARQSMPEPEFDPANLSRMDILQLAIDSEKERLLLEQKIQQDAPRVAFAKQVEVIPDSMSVSQAAKILGTGRTRLYAFLRQVSWVTRRNEPYQSKIEAGYLDVKISQWEHPEKGIQECITTLVTGKGLSRIHELWNQNKDAITQCHSTGHMVN